MQDEEAQQHHRAMKKDRRAKVNTRTIFERRLVLAGDSD